VSVVDPVATILRDHVTLEVECLAFADQAGVPLVDFKRGERKDDVAKANLARFTGNEGVLFIGRTQEKRTSGSEAKLAA
jgi:hypothetical protein